MYFHVLFMNIDKDVGDEFFARVQSCVARVLRELEGVSFFHFGPNVSGFPSQYTHVCIGAFTSSAAHDAYQASAVHAEMVAFMLPGMTAVTGDLDTRGA